MTLLDFLKSRCGADDQTIGFIVASNINLQNETIRRLRQNKVIYGPHDALDLLMMLDIGLDKTPHQPAPPLEVQKFAPKLNQDALAAALDLEVKS